MTWCFASHEADPNPIIQIVEHHAHKDKCQREIPGLVVRPAACRLCQTKAKSLESDNSSLPSCQQVPFSSISEACSQCEADFGRASVPFQFPSWKGVQMPSMRLRGKRNVRPLVAMNIISLLKFFSGKRATGSSDN